MTLLAFAALLASDVLLDVGTRLRLWGMEGLGIWDAIPDEWVPDSEDAE